MLAELLEGYRREKVIKTLSPFLSQERMKIIDRVVVSRMSSVQVAIERPGDVHNACAIIRTAEALGASSIHFIDAQLKKGQGKGTTKGTMKWVHLHRHPSLRQFTEKKGEVMLAGACSNGINTIEDLPLDRSICFLFGNEKVGISPEGEKVCDFLFRIPIFGMVESYNLSVAAAITLYDYMGRKRKKLGRKGDLSEEEIMEEKAQFYVRSLGVEKSIQILRRYLG